VIRIAFAPPRNPLARVGLGVLGVALLGALSLLGLALAALVALGFAGRALWLRLAAPRPAAPANDPAVLEGEFTVINQAALPRPRVTP